MTGEGGGFTLLDPVRPGREGKEVLKWVMACFETFWL